jgi:hypothetical protein
MNAALLSAVQAHDSPVMTSTVRESPPAGTMAVISVGTVSGHGSTASDGGGVTVVVDSVGVSPATQPALNAASSSHTREARAVNVCNLRVINAELRRIVPICPNHNAAFKIRVPRHSYNDGCSVS